MIRSQVCRLPPASLIPSLSPSLFIKDPDTVVSRSQIYKLGFFTPKSSTNRYLAVLYNASDQTVIWVANRDNPLNDSSGIAKISEDDNLVLINAQNRTVWSTNITSPRNTSAQILDTGNLVLWDNATGTIIWDSFSYPSNYLMPTMRLSENINTGKKVILSSWKNESDPTAGSFTHGIKALDVPQTFIWNNGRPYCRSGPWNGQIFIGIKDMYNTYMTIATIMNDSAGTFYFTIPDPKLLTKMELNSSGTMVQTMVYSFGVMIVEIIKGRKTTHYYNHELSLSLLGCAWKFWSEGNGLAFADESIANSNIQEEITRCIHIALLCVQEFPNDRPTIQTVLSMLSCEILDLPTPKQPAFCRDVERATEWNDSACQPILLH